VSAASFRAPTRARDLAGFAFLYAILVSFFAFPRRQDIGPLAVILPLFCVLVAGLAIAIRSARLEVSQDGVRWGWDRLSFRVGLERFRLARIWPNAVAVVPRRGTPWVLVPRDWEPFDALRTAFVAAGLPLEEQPRPAPRRVRVQGYGWLLDVLVWLNVAVTTAMMLL